MKDVAKIIIALGSTNSYNSKIELLKRYEKVEGLKEILRFIYNPYCKTGISDAKLNKVLEAMPASTGFSKVEWPDAIKYFSANRTGSDKDLAYARSFIYHSQREYGNDAMRLACAIVTQNLKIGVTATSLNKAYGESFIPKIGCMLGTLYGDVPAHKVKWPCIVTEKLDGIRRVLIKENGVCNFYSRSGHADTGLQQILEEAKHLPDNFVYDGELLAIGKFDNCIAQRQATNSIANSKGIKTGLSFNIFDMIPLEDFYSGECAIPASQRKVRLGATLMDSSIKYLVENSAQAIAAFGVHEDLKYIKPVAILGVVKAIEEVTPIVEEIWRRGGEGVMLNTNDGPYEVKRTKHLLKIKHTEEHVLKVVDLIEGTGKFEDSLGALVVSYTDSMGNENYLGVGSGFTDAQRKKIWSNPKKYIGLAAEIECFGESVNAAGMRSLNCPIFKRFVGVPE